jgi:hypothetical protein
MICDPEQSGAASSGKRRSGRDGCAAEHKALAAIAIVVLSLFLPLTLPAQKAAPVKPSEDSQLYRNTTFGFRYEIPYGWVDRAKEMRAGNEASAAAVLLAVFERPPEATGSTVNSAVVIASESVSSYRGLKTAEDYLGPLTELVTANGFKTDGEPDVLAIDSRELVHADFVKPLNGKSDTTDDNLTMRQRTLVLVAKGQIVSFTFIAASKDELDDLMDGLHFGISKASAH